MCRAKLADADDQGYGRLIFFFGTVADVRRITSLKLHGVSARCHFVAGTSHRMSLTIQDSGECAPQKPQVSRGERRKPRRTGHFGARGGQDKECVFKQSWPSTAEYRMMKLKKSHKSVAEGEATS